MILCNGRVHILSNSGEFCYDGVKSLVVYRVRPNTCPCTAQNRGVLRYQNDTLEICNGNDYVAVGGNKGGLGTMYKPAKSCQEILKENP